MEREFYLEILVLEGEDERRVVLRIDGTADIMEIIGNGPDSKYLEEYGIEDWSTVAKTIVCGMMEEFDPCTPLRPPEACMEVWRRLYNGRIAPKSARG